MYARVSFTQGTPGGAVGLLSNRQGNGSIEDIASGSVHIVFGATYAQVGFYEKRVYSTPATFNYVGIVQDGATAYDLGWTLVGDTIYMEYRMGRAGNTRIDACKRSWARISRMSCIGRRNKRMSSSPL